MPLWWLGAGLAAGVLVLLAQQQMATPTPQPAPPIVQSVPPPTALAPAGQQRIGQVLAGDLPQSQRGALAASAHLLVGDVLRVGSGQGCVLGLDDGTRISLLDGAELHLHSSQRLELRSGLMRAEVAPQRGAGLVVATPQAEARVLGTEFSLAVDTGAVRLAVDEGRVEFAQGAQALVCTAGQRAQASSAGVQATLNTSQPGVERLLLVDTSSNTVLCELREGLVLHRAALPATCNVQAITRPALVGSVRIELDQHGQTVQGNTEHREPYGLIMNGVQQPGQLNSWQPWTPPLGMQAITATAFAQAGLRGASGSLRVRYLLVP